MIRLLRPIAAHLKPILILLTILIGVMVVLARLLLPLISGYREDVQQIASDMLGQPVEISKLSAQWRGFGPELVLKGIHLANPESSLATFQLTEVRVGIGIIDSLKSGILTPREITLYGVHLRIKRLSDGSIHLSGLDDLDLEEHDDTSVFSLPYRISLKQGELLWEDHSIEAKPQRFTNVTITLTNTQERHQLDAVLSMPNNSEARITLAADINGELHRPGGWSGDFFLRGNKLDMGQLLGGSIPDSYSISGNAYMELWSRWEQGELSTLQGGINWQQLKLSSDQPDANGNPRLLQLDELGGEIKWQQQRDDWQLDIAEIKLAHSGKQWPTANLSVVGEYDVAGFLHLRSGIDFLRVEDLLAISGLFPLPDPEIEQALATIQPQADLHALQFRFDESPSGSNWSARGKIRKLFTNPWEMIPGVKNLAANFWANRDRGELLLQGEGTSADFPQLFRDMLELDKISGLLRWKRRQSEGWQIETSELRASNQDITSRTRLRIDIPADPDQSPRLDLQTNFHDGDASTTSRYLPVTIMPDAVVEWLDRSLVSGHVTSGSCIFQGPIHDFPFEDNHRGRFEVLFEVEDMVLDYWPEWPRSENLTAEVRFLNNRFDAWVESGKILSSDLHNIHGRIEHLATASPFLLSGKVSGPLRDELRILSESPLAERFSTLAAAVQADGTAELQLDIAIPIEKGQFRLDGKLNFQDSKLLIKEWDLPITSIAGELILSESGVKAQNLQGKLLGEGVSADVTTIKSSGTTRIKGTTILSSKAVDRQFPGNHIAEIKGRTPWQLQLDLPPLSGTGSEQPLKMQLTSDLKGIHIDQPHPFGKTAKQKRRIQIDTELGTTSRRHIKVRYHNLGEAYMLLDDSGPKTRLIRADITLGGGPARLPKSNILRIDGRLHDLNLNPRLTAANPAGTKLPPVVINNLKISKLRYGDTVLEDLTLNLSSNDTSFGGRISSKSMEGNIRIPVPLKHGPIVAHLERLDLAFNPDNIENKGRTPWADPRTLPGLDLQSKQTTINGRDYGLLKLNATHTKDGINLKNIALTSDQLTLSASGEWIMFNGRPQTAIDLTMLGSSLGKLLKHLGFAPTLEGAPVEIDTSLRWSGNPNQFSSTDLHGKLDMHLQKGRLLDVSPGMGRVFGLLNLGALQRRLTLDFSDLFKKGLSFDRIDGSFTLDDGDAHSDNLQIKGPAADIEITGRTGLVKQDFDQVVTVTPKLTGSLPVIGALAGGPAVGAAIYIAQKIVGKKVDESNNRVYTISGPWDEPTITLQRHDFTAELSNLDSQTSEADAPKERPKPATKSESKTWQHPLYKDQ